MTIAVCGCLFAASCRQQNNKPQETVNTVEVRRGDLRIEVSATGSVLPQNRLEVKPTLGGRVDSMLVKEGDRVRAGDILCWMSSTERAALVDTAKSKGDTEVAYWNEVYKPMPLVAPIDGEVIVRAAEPGQSVSAGTAVLVLSDRLIVRARVDETDIGRLAVGQKARVELDAYPDVKVAGEVVHISYESRVVNNVTVYEVDVVTSEIPTVFRSGMSATVFVVCKSREGVLILPLDAVSNDGTNTWVVASEARGAETRKPVSLGLATDQHVEIRSGLAEGEAVVARKKQFSSSMIQTLEKSPFMPSGPQGNRGRH